MKSPVYVKRSLGSGVASIHLSLITSLRCATARQAIHQPSLKARRRTPQVFRFIAILLCLTIARVTLASETTGPSQASKDEQALWNLEHAYWRYVQDNDLSAYADLWHKDFLGWPSVSATPVHKDHITDWITSQTSKGLKFKTGEFKPAALQVTGDVAVACYWITFKWLDKEGNGAAHTIRITHAWLRTGNDWRIIGGMSMPEPETPRK